MGLALAGAEGAAWAAPSSSLSPRARVTIHVRTVTAREWPTSATIWHVSTRAIPAREATPASRGRTPSVNSGRALRGPVLFDRRMRRPGMTPVEIFVAVVAIAFLGWTAF